MAEIYLNAILLVTIIMISRINCISPGYSFAKFKGPVSGPEHKVKYHDNDSHGNDHVDYVAKPDYHFAYGVQDPKSKNHQSRQETRHGDTVHGEYSVLDPDGKMRTVQYTADKAHGFQAKVITDGHVIYHPQQGQADRPHGNTDHKTYHHYQPSAPTPHQPAHPDESAGDDDGDDDGDGDYDDEYRSNESANSDDSDYEGGDGDGDEDYY